MNEFEKRTAEFMGKGLFSKGVEIVQVNVGLRCNQSCKHCHLQCSPTRTEIMTWSVMSKVIDVARKTKCDLVDITGGAPELNSNFRLLLDALCEEGLGVQVRTNLTALLEPGMEDLPEFFCERRVRLVASMPCYLETNVRAQRGSGVYEKSIAVLRRLNSLGYGTDAGLMLNLVYNPGGPSLPPGQSGLEQDYRRELGKRFGIEFSSLLTIINMPIGRFQEELCRTRQDVSYMQLLKSSFNPETLDNVMCRHQVSVGWDGMLYDCDFNLALGMPVDHGAPNHLSRFDIDAEVLGKRRIVTGDHCFGCTAGRGSSCRGALA